MWRGSAAEGDADDDFLPLIDMSYGSVILTDTYSELSLMLPSNIAYGQGAGSLSFDSNTTTRFAK